jgi:protein phosphatase
MNDNPKLDPNAKAPVPDAVAVAVTVCGATDLGRICTDNEDAFAIVDMSSGAAVALGSEKRIPFVGRAVLLIVCDGMGGAAAGEVAARLAGEVVAHEISQMGGTSGSSQVEPLRAALKLANQVIFEESRHRAGERGMGTTCTAGLLFAGRVVLAEVGDSRAYLFRAGKLRQLTRDQSLAAAMVDSGALTSEEAKTFPHSNVILQALGVQDHVEPVTSEIEPAPGDVLLLCSDGLHGPVPAERIAAILRDGTGLASCTRALISAALAAGGPDNVTVILARHEGLSQSQDPLRAGR